MRREGRMNSEEGGEDEGKWSRRGRDRREG